ncbi:MAG: hypothetical protein GX097_01210 [Methanomicrobiales archaeon]|jgi:hypothetical protein|nr:hypothetical protein [Methanomicrobiales archaeon]
MSNSGVDTYSYQGWLNSDSFWKRALGIFGYYFVGSLAFFLVIAFAIMVLTIVFAVISVFVFGMAVSL